MFLFTGDQPLKLTFYAPGANVIQVSPAAGRPRLHGRLLMRWRREYSAIARQQRRDGDYPQLVETYLTSMLSRRLGLPTPLLS